MPRQRIHDKPIIPDHILQLSFAVTCDLCKKRKKEIWKKYKKNVCWQCGNQFIAKMTSRPFRAMCAATACLLLTLCAGCQVPREMRVDAHVAGQTLKVQVVR